MRPSDFFTEETVQNEFFGISTPMQVRRVKAELLDELRRRPLADTTDVEVAVSLARVVHDDLQAYGTGGGNAMGDEDLRLALQALTRVLGRLGIEFELPFRDFTAFNGWWKRNGAHNSYQARRDLLAALFDDLHDKLADLELEALDDDALADPISPHSRTGWVKVDEEISELRRHFRNARTPQDYRAVGLDCVAVTEALSRQVYDVERHLRGGEEEPPVASTKHRIVRFVEDSAPGPDNATLRKLARAAIEYAQLVKHSSTPTRREAGIAADAVIQLANLLRRLDEPG
jgi:hypothetical protein